MHKDFCFPSLHQLVLLQVPTLLLNLRQLVYNDAFGRDPYNPPNLQGIEFRGDRGYFSENAFLSICCCVVASLHARAPEVSGCRLFYTMLKAKQRWQRTTNALR